MDDISAAAPLPLHGIFSPVCGNAGIDGKYCDSPERAKEAMLDALKDESIGILLITDSIADALAQTVSDIKLNYTTPLLVEIPNSDSPERPHDTIMKIVHDAIGM